MHMIALLFHWLWHAGVSGEEEEAVVAGIMMMAGEKKMVTMMK